MRHRSSAFQLLLSVWHLAAGSELGTGLGCGLGLSALRSKTDTTRIGRNICFSRIRGVPRVAAASSTSPQASAAAWLGFILLSLEPGSAVAIHSDLDASCAAVDAAVDAKRRQIETLEAFRESLIHECVTGKRRVTEEDLSRVKADG